VQALALPQLSEEEREGLSALTSLTRLAFTAAGKGAVGPSLLPLARLQELHISLAHVLESFIVLHPRLEWGMLRMLRGLRRLSVRHLAAYAFFPAPEATWSDEAPVAHEAELLLAALPNIQRMELRCPGWLRDSCLVWSWEGMPARAAQGRPRQRCAWIKVVASSGQQAQWQCQAIHLTGAMYGLRGRIPQAKVCTPHASLGMHPPKTYSPLTPATPPLHHCRLSYCRLQEEQATPEGEPQQLIVPAPDPSGCPAGSSSNSSASPRLFLRSIERVPKQQPGRRRADGWYDAWWQPAICAQLEAATAAAGQGAAMPEGAAAGSNGSGSSGSSGRGGSAAAAGQPQLQLQLHLEADQEAAAEALDRRLVDTAEVAGWVAIRAGSHRTFDTLVTVTLAGIGSAG